MGVNQSEELLSLAQKKSDKFSKANRDTAGKFLLDSIEKYESVLEIIENMKDSAAEESSEYNITDEESNDLEIIQFSTLLELGRTQSIRGVYLLTEADISKNQDTSKSLCGDALFLFKQSYNHFADCLTQEPKNDVALRHWGTTLCKEAFTLKVLEITSPDPMK